MNLDKIRDDFPILQKEFDGRAVIYFDNACMTLKPRQVVEAMNEYYFNISSCAGRSIHKLGSEATIRFDESRDKIKKFINAKDSKEIIFTKNTTESINLISRSLNLVKGDIVITSDREHNSNLIPWHIQKKLRCIDHKIVRSNEDNTFNIEDFENIMNDNVRLVAMAHTSNLDGYTIPAEEIIKIAHDYDALVLLDGAQSTPSRIIDVQKLDVDFFAFSSHKMLGPTGFGVLYGKYDELDKLSPFIVGGNSVESSTYDSSVLLDLPEKFEAGLQDYAGAIGAAAAVDYISDIGKDNILNHEYQLNRFLTDNLKDVNGFKIIGPKDPKERGGIISFNISGFEPHTITMLLDEVNIMSRSGVFCVHSWFNANNMKGAIRVSLYLYNTIDECKIFVERINEIIKK